MSALGIPKNITLESDDENIVCQLMKRNNISMNSQKMVTLHPKITMHGTVIYSRYSRRVQKRNSYTVAFTDPEAPAHLNYGYVKSFLTCPADSQDCIYIALIKILRLAVAINC